VSLRVLDNELRNAAQVSEEFEDCREFSSDALVYFCFGPPSIIEGLTLRPQSRRDPLLNLSAVHGSRRLFNSGATPFTDAFRSVPIHAALLVAERILQKAGGVIPLAKMAH